MSFKRFYLILYFVALIVFFIRIFPPAAVTDTYYHLSVGRTVFEERKIPHEDNSTYGIDNKKIVSTEWLSGLIFFVFYKFLGANGLYILRILLIFPAILLIYKALRLAGSSRMVALILQTITSVVISMRINDRPENFSYLFISILGYVLIKFYVKKRVSKLVYLFPLIFFLWPHIHAYASLGLIMFSAIVTQVFLEQKLKKTKFQNYNLFLLIYIIVLLVSVLNYERLTYFSLTKKYEILLTEWVSLIELVKKIKLPLFLNPQLFPYLSGLILLTLVSFFNLKNFRNKGYLLPVTFSTLILILLPIKYFRLLPAVIIWTTPWTLFLAKQFLFKRILLATKILLFVLFLQSVMVIFMTILNGKIWSFKFLNDPLIAVQNHNKKIFTTAYWNEDFPANVPPLISTYLNTHKLFASNYWNSYFMWYLPNAKIYSNVIFENVTADTFQNELSLRSGANNWQDLLKKYDIDTVVNGEADAYFVGQNFTPVYSLSNWKLVYTNNVAAIYARDDIIKKLPVDLSAINLGLNTDLKFKPENERLATLQLENLLAFDPSNDFARIQLILYWRDKNINKANDLALNSRALLPQNPWFSFLLASINARQSNCDLAKKYAKEVIKKSLNDTFVHELTQKTIEKCNINI